MYLIFLDAFGVSVGDSTSSLRHSVVDPPPVLIFLPMLGGPDKTLAAPSNMQGGKRENGKRGTSV